MPDSAPQRRVAQHLAEFISTSRWSTLDATIRHQARRSLLNHVSCALGVARDPAIATALTVMRQFSAAPVATVIGQGCQLDAMAASFVNAIASNLLDFDDTHLATVIHPSAPVAPPLLALAEQRALSGEAVLHAFLLGMEVSCRLGLGVSPGHYARGWHITASAGVFGAAAGCAKLLHLSSAQTAHALGIAASQSSGLVENLPSAAKNVAVGNAARNGLLAALFAEAGYEAAPAAIEGPLGWACASGDAADLGAMTGELGQRWEAGRNTYKPYPAGIVFHALIDACLLLRSDLRAPANPDEPAETAFLLDVIESVDVAGDALLLARGDRPVHNARDARVSIHHSAALGLLRGRAGVEDFEQPAVDDPDLAALRARVHARLDASLPRGAVAVAVRLRDGRTLQRTVLAARGSEAMPLTDADLEAKYLGNMQLGGTTDQADAQLDLLWRFDQQPDVAAIMGLLRGTERAV